MRNLQRVQTVLAFAMPISATIPLLWSIAMQGFFTAVYIADPNLLPLFFVAVILPLFAYCVLGAIVFFSARRKGVGLTILLWTLLIPVVALSGFLIVATAYSAGVFSLLFYGPPPSLAIVASLISLASRVAARTTSDLL